MEINWEKGIQKTGFILIILLCISLFISKAAINGFLLLLIILSLIYIVSYERKFFIEKKYVTILLATYIIGFFLSCFSHSGFEGSGQFLNQFKFMLTILPFAVFVRNKNSLKVLIVALTISAILAVLYGLFKGQFSTVFNGKHPVGRTADMLMLVILINSVLVFNLRKKLPIRIFLGISIPILIYATIMTESRGAWVGWFLGSVFYILFFKRKLILPFILIILLISIIFNNKTDRFNSIANTNTNHSNVSRLNLWVTGIEFSKENLFFGTGIKKGKELYQKFLSSKPMEYQEKYKNAFLYTHDFHNSFLEIFIKNGLIFFTLFMSSLFYIIYTQIKNYKKLSDDESLYVIAALTSTIGFFATQCFHTELISYGAIIFYLILFSGCLVVNPYLENGLKKES
ncbi:MAG: O-antigen ligase family protein [Desulfobacterales bacterium]|nr:O-antigen ligase family protein [Desulfobacterales bacterium]